MFLPHTIKEERELQGELEEEKARFVRGESSLDDLERNVEAIWKYGRSWRTARLYESRIQIEKWIAIQKANPSSSRS